MNKINQELIDLGFKISSSGIMYWLDAIDYVKNHPKDLKMMKLYNYISNKHNKTRSAIERAMRISLQGAIPRIKAKYNYTGKITNTAFVNLIKLEGGIK